MKDLDLDVIRLDGGTQPRAELDPDVVEDYALALKNGAKFPPVVVFYDGKEYWLADGFHRVNGALAACLETIKADVRQGTLEDAQWFSFSANQSNGLRRSNADKRRAVEAALAHPNAAKKSDRQIALHVGVHNDTVSEARKRLSESDSELKETKRVGRDGRTINTANIGRKPFNDPRQTISHEESTKRNGPIVNEADEAPYEPVESGSDLPEDTETRIKGVAFKEEEWIALRVEEAAARARGFGKRKGLNNKMKRRIVAAARELVKAVKEAQGHD